ncbi:MAG: carboxypeptidase-like regulatory domain-containing protein [Sediminibacterium sp.]|nr:carboxypeptidase-like regulatory domain-containing protein [Sediminibacterium sp.]
MKKISFLLMMSLMTFFVNAQIVTSGSLSGIVRDAQNRPLSGATVKAVHTPTGTVYSTETDAEGAYDFNAVRVGGPFRIEASYVGLEKGYVDDVYTSLGITTNIDLVLKSGSSSTLEAVTVSSNKNLSFSRNKTGSAQQFGRREINAVPILGARNITSITKYNSLGNGASFGGLDPRYNNFSVDGSNLNEAFGLAGGGSVAGGRTGVGAVSIDAIEQIQVNISPYDIRQSGFTGAGINAVTKSGSNEIEASVYGTYRDASANFLGTTANGVNLPLINFKEQLLGGRIGFPIVKNKLFGFVNIESYENTEPAFFWYATGSGVNSPNLSRVTPGLLDSVSAAAAKWGFTTGPYQNYDRTTKATKLLGKLDWNINEKNKINFRVVSQTSSQYNSISGSLGGPGGLSGVPGNRYPSLNNLLFSLPFQNSGYIQNDNTISVVSEWTSQFSKKVSSDLIIGYDYANQDRGTLDDVFPTVDVTRDGTVLATIGTDPFTNNNKLNYSTFHVTENLTINLKNNTIVTGINFESFISNNVFFPSSNGVYGFNNLDSFYNAINQTVANGGAPSTTKANYLALRYSLLPGGAEPLQQLKTSRIDLYVQDQLQASKRLVLLFGLRVSFISFENTAYFNPYVPSLNLNNNFYNTQSLPNTAILPEPRIGFNWDILGNKSFILRGGSGIFTGRPPYVFISNAVGNNGVLTGLIQGANTYGLTANPRQYFVPENPTIPTTGFDLALVSGDYKFPQAWKSDVALEYHLPFGLNLSAEYNYNQYLNAVNYYNANFNSNIVQRYNVNNGDGDYRVYYAGGTGSRWNSNVTNAIVLNNRDGAYFSAITLKVEWPLKKGFYGFVAYTRSEAKDYMGAGSIAASSWNGARSATNNNDLRLANSDNLTPDRFVGLFNYRIEYGKPFGGATTITLGVTASQPGVFSYTVNGDINKDGNNANDLLYVPTDAQIDNMSFAAYTATSTVAAYTPDQQRAALKAYINQDPYLKNIRGQYSERNGAVLPFLVRADLSIAQDIYYKVKNNRRHGLQVRFDILNFTNLISSDWGFSYRSTNPQILVLANTPTNTVKPQYRLATQTNYDGTTSLLSRSYTSNASIADVWQMQIGVRYYIGRQ